MNLEKLLKKVGKELDDGINSLDTSLETVKAKVTDKYNTVKAEIELATELRKTENEPTYKLVQAGCPDIHRNLTLDQIFGLLAQVGVEISEES